MRLSNIKLAGFKSFVDPTTIHLPSKRVGIVGPNGCGKSNVIDAVRWVMGESSAKHLRGESMDDVIFNGSSTRNSVGQAFVELNFDNTEGKVGGAYAKYNQISVKRLVTREGQSKYFLNNTHCRRRDIADIFLGTGLGPRSYAIIEQGMVSRLIEAKPEELRVYIEEAAGISKYKERRRETENRIRHTRENLDRLNDLREEIEKQLEKLKRQARTAERYKVLKQEEKQVQAELLALRWQELEKQVSERETELEKHETQLQSLIAEQRAFEASIETLRAENTELNDGFNQVQSRYYTVGAEISRTEQTISHTTQLRENQKQELEKAQVEWRDAEQHITGDKERLLEIEAELNSFTPELEKAEEVRLLSSESHHETETAMTDLQVRWDAFNFRANKPVQLAQVEKTRIEHLERQLEQQQQRRSRIDDELSRLNAGGDESELTALSEQVSAGLLVTEQCQASLDQLGEELAQSREQVSNHDQSLNSARSDQQKLQGRIASIEALQQSALGKQHKPVIDWLDKQGLADYPRLAERLDVEAGWEHAVEIVLSGYLEAVCIDSIDSVAKVLESLDQGSLMLIDGSHHDASAAANVKATALIEKVSSDLTIDDLLNGIYIAEDLDMALHVRQSLNDSQSVITPDGIWLGRNWVRVAREKSVHDGVLQRENQLKELQNELEQTSSRVQKTEALLEAARAQQKACEQKRETVQAELQHAHRQHSELSAELSGRKMHLDQVKSRQQRLLTEKKEITEQCDRDQVTMAEANKNKSNALAEIERFDQERETLQKQREALTQALEDKKQQAQSDRDGVHAIAIRVESLRTAQSTTERNLERMQHQLEQYQVRCKELEESISNTEKPLLGYQDSLKKAIEDRVKIEAEMTSFRSKVEAVDTQLRNADQKRVEKEQQVTEKRAHLESERLNTHEVRVRRNTVKEQFPDSDFVLEDLLAELSEDSSASEWDEKLSLISQKIHRLGPINLAAIEEFEEQSERKEYLDTQNEDLCAALDTLESAIRKIDRETRSRFKETFDKINAKLQEIFPRLFGGGQGYLEMTGDDLLSTGVAIMARPPGKRISNINLLSGGEKAMTSVAMIFSIFELNPSPFCMLDEVDAPLDEANVGRFCALVEEMSERVQFIIITHNKHTMELANQLTGVTMREAGVSRLVSVDIDEAAEMVAV